MKQTVAYVRVSTANQVENGEGLEIQKDRITGYCKDKGLTICRFYEDKGISGAIRDRTGLLELLKDCESKKVERIIVYKFDRLARDLTISLWLETQFKKHDVEVSSVVDPEYNLDDPLQKAFKRIADIFAELEKDVIAARLKEGRINNTKKGERGSGPVLFGYVKVGDKLKINPEEAKYVNKIFRWAVKGCRYSDIVRRLSKMRVTTKRGKAFQIQSLKYILSNKMYYGETSFGDLKAKGVHPPIISKRLFLKAQRKVGIAV